MAPPSSILLKPRFSSRSLRFLLRPSASTPAPVDAIWLLPRSSRVSVLFVSSTAASPSIPSSDMPFSLRISSRNVRFFIMPPASQLQPVLPNCALVTRSVVTERSILTAPANFSSWLYPDPITVESLRSSSTPWPPKSSAVSTPRDCIVSLHLDTPSSALPARLKLLIARSRPQSTAQSTRKESRSSTSLLPLLICCWPPPSVARGNDGMAGWAFAPDRSDASASGTDWGWRKRAPRSSPLCSLPPCCSFSNSPE
mmetsp:Transcript_73442/g.208083  ORF Transcript_73442/g.208083 Transcript_73442/m.208083 type:complete len:255 (-) Transcript_73442:82-846(-)